MKRSQFVCSVFCISALFALTACHQSKSTAQTHSHAADAAPHEEEENTAQITVWSERYEIFAEHKAPVVGKPTKFITHVSDIRTGEARRSGLIRFEFKGPGQEFAHPQAGPERPGIYIPAITFPAAGDWKASVLITGDEPATVELGTIRVYPNADAVKRAEFPEPPEGISFLKEQQWRILAQSRPVRKRTLVERAPLSATVVAAPGSKALVHSTVTGTLMGGSDLPRLGATVKAGQTLAWVQPAFGEFTTRLVHAEADAIRTKAALDQAETVHERTKRLFEQQAKSERELKDAEVALRTAQASYQAAAAVQVLYKNTGASFEGGAVKIGIASPIDGVLDRVFATAGARVTAEEPVFSVVNPKTAMVQANVPENRLRLIDPDVEATFTPSGVGTNSIPLKLVAIGREVDAATRTAPATFEIAAENQTVALGSVGVLQMGTRKVVEALAVPSEALVEEDGVPVVFVQVAGETYQKRDVALGVRDGNWIEVKAGISEGERVATEGAYAILLSTKSGTIPAHGHAH
jgi:membrane fusion protein, heavy metal efflux system